MEHSIRCMTRTPAEPSHLSTAHDRESTCLTHASGYGVVVAVDGSTESDAATRWAGREAEMRGSPITLMHVVVPVVVSWPVGTLQGSFSQWQEDNAHDVIGQAQKILQAEFDVSELPAVHTEVRPGTTSPN